MKKIKYLILMSLSFVLITGCSSKYPSVKKGATYGALTGVVTAIAVGTLDTNSDDSLIGIVAIFLGLVGSLVGAGIGYGVDNLSHDDKKLQEIQDSHNMMRLE